MTSEIWNKLDIKEQLSNIHGEVKRLIRAHNNFVNGVSKENHTNSYMQKVHTLIELTCSDPKNVGRENELFDEENEIKRWIQGEVDDDYILRYWEQYTNAISF